MSLETNGLDSTGLGQSIVAAIDAVAEELVAVSHAIHERPELAFQERFACGLLRDTVAAHGLPVSTGVYTLETALESEFTGGPGPKVALLAEYDALPGIGHACGHNIIATSALGAMLGLHAVAERLPGAIRLLGTPAEEKGGGKELMALNDEWRTAAGEAKRADIWKRMLKIHADEVFTIGIVANVRQPVVISNRLRNVPKAGVWNWDPGAFFGMYGMDGFWFDDKPQARTASAAR